eukprot:157118_1
MMQILTSFTFILTISEIKFTESGIINDYVSSDKLIQSGLIQSVINDDLISFSEYVADLGWNQNKSDTLFSFIQQTASPQLGPGLAFGQFERRSAYHQNDQSEYVEFTHLINARNIELSPTKGIKFDYEGIYKVNVEFEGGMSGDTLTWFQAKIVGYMSTIEVGRSVLFHVGGAQYNAWTLMSCTFLVDIHIQDVDDVYMLQFNRHGGADFNVHWGEFVGEAANIVLVVENVGQL